MVIWPLDMAVIISLRVLAPPQTRGPEATPTGVRIGAPFMTGWFMVVPFLLASP